MKCNICDKDMSDKETSFNEELETFEPCTVCLDVAFDAAFSNGFSRDDEDKYVILGDADDWDDYGSTESREGIIETDFRGYRGYGGDDTD